MRGALRVPGWGPSAAGLVILALLAPLAAGAITPGPSVLEFPEPVLDGVPSEAAGLVEDACRSAPCTSWQDWLEWTEDAPLENVAELLVAMAEHRHGGPVAMPQPTIFHDYEGLDESTQRHAWREWYLASLIAAEQPLFTPRAAMQEAAAQQVVERVGGGGAGGAATPPDGLGDPRGLKGVWRIEAHGVPREVLPAGPEGATFLVTSNSVLFFPAAGEDPEWMVRPKTGVAGVRIAAGAGDVHDLVIATYGGLQSSEPTILVVDGTTGTVTFRGFAGDERLAFWTVTDADDDGIEDILGVDVLGNAVAVRLDGTPIYRQPLPSMDPPSASPPLVPVFLGFVHSHHWYASIFADVNGDGTQDLVVPGNYWLIVDLFVTGAAFQMPSVTAYSGRDLALIWEVQALPSMENSFTWIVDSGDVTGDGRDDVLLMEYRWASYPIGDMETVAILLRAGEDGEVVVRDEVQYLCNFVCIPLGSEDFYEPIALLDVAEGGGKEILGVLWDDSYEEEGGLGSEFDITLVVRAPGNEDGGPSEEVARHTFTIHDDWFLGESFFMRESLAGQGDELLLTLSRIDPATREGVTDFIRLNQAGLEQVELPALMGLIDMDPVTGRLYGWEIRTDRWGPMGEDLQLASGTMRVVVSISPLLFEDRNRDGTPDMLVWRSMGYRWMDGRTGELLEDLDRPITRFLRATNSDEGRTVLLEGDYLDWVEYEWEGLYLVDLRGNPVWTLDPEAREPGYFRGLFDFTGNGRPEVLMQEPGEMSGSSSPPGFNGGSFSWTPGDFFMLRMPGAEQIWTHTAEDTGLHFVDAIPARRGLELVVQDRSGDDVALRLMVAGEDEPRWSTDVDAYRGGASGLLIVVPLGVDEEGFALLDGSTGESVHWEALPESDGNGTYHFGPRLLLDVDRDGVTDLVQMYRTGSEEGEDLEQSVRIVDWARNRTLASFSLLDAPVTLHEFTWGDETYTYYTIDYAYLSGAVGDWNGDGVVDFALNEQGWPTVRSGRTGDLLAVAPASGSFGPMVDLNGDGRMELGLREGSRLRMFTYADGAVIEAENETERVSDPANVGTQEEGAADLFERSPGPAAAFLVLAVFAAAAALRRRTG